MQVDSSSKIKAFFSNTYTSISIMLIVFGSLNQFQLTKVANEIKEDNVAMHLTTKLDDAKQRIKDRERDSLYIVNLVDKIGIQNGSLVDYGLINDNIISSEKRVTRNVIAHNKMMMQTEHDKFSLFEMDWLGRPGTLMKATLRKDSLPLLEEIKIGN